MNAKYDYTKMPATTLADYNERDGALSVQIMEQMEREVHADRQRRLAILRAVFRLTGQRVPVFRVKQPWMHHPQFGAILPSHLVKVYGYCNVGMTYPAAGSPRMWIDPHILREALREGTVTRHLVPYPGDVR